MEQNKINFIAELWKKHAYLTDCGYGVQENNFWKAIEEYDKSFPVEAVVKVQIADFVKDLIRLLDGEYAPSFDSIPDKYKEDFKGWANEIKQQEWEHNWQKAWQIYNREYIVYYLQNLEC